MMIVDYSRGTWFPAKPGDTPGEMEPWAETETTQDTSEHRRYGEMAAKIDAAIPL